MSPFAIQNPYRKPPEPDRGWFADYQEVVHNPNVGCMFHNHVIVEQQLV